MSIKIKFSSDSDTKDFYGEEAKKVLDAFDNALRYDEYYFKVDLIDYKQTFFLKHIEYVIQED